jgi:large subunit ribosomal protein L13
MNKETQYVKTAECQNDWYLVDAKGLTLGRFASRIALILQGKNKPTYTRAVDNGDYVVVINADKFKVTKNKLNTMYHNHYTGNIGGQYKQSLNQVLEKHPERVVHHAVQKMLPKGILGKKMLKKLKVYVGTEHPHVAQAPKIIQSL